MLEHHLLESWCLDWSHCCQWGPYQDKCTLWGSCDHVFRHVDKHHNWGTTYVILIRPMLIIWECYFYTSKRCWGSKSGHYVDTSQWSTLTQPTLFRNRQQCLIKVGREETMGSAPERWTLYNLQPNVNFNTCLLVQMSSTLGSQQDILGYRLNKTACLPFWQLERLLIRCLPLWFHQRRGSTPQHDSIEWSPWIWIMYQHLQLKIFR